MLDLKEKRNGKYRYSLYLKSPLSNFIFQDFTPEYVAAKYPGSAIVQKLKQFKLI